jgi:hypothetical protein
MVLSLQQEAEDARQPSRRRRSRSKVSYLPFVSPLVDLPFGDPLPIFSFLVRVFQAC